MRRQLAGGIVLAVLLCLPPAGAAQDGPKRKAVPLVVSGDTLTVVRSLPFRVTAPAGRTLYDFSFPDGVRASAEDNVLTVSQAPKGAFVVRVRMTVIDFEKKSVTRETAEVEVNFGGVEPPAPPPGPGPPPPPTPGPPPTPAPIPEAGLRVLIVYETAELSKLTKAQEGILYSTGFRGFLDSVCVGDPQTGTKKAWWMLDKDADVSALAKSWQDAMKRPRASVPWMIVSNHPKGGWEGPLPANVEEATATVKKYAESKGKGGKR